MYFYEYKVEGKSLKNVCGELKGWGDTTKFDTEHYQKTQDQISLLPHPLHNNASTLDFLSNIKKPRPVYSREPLEVLSIP